MSFEEAVMYFCRMSCTDNPEVYALLSDWWLILTYILSSTISKLLQIIGQIFTFNRGYLSLTHVFWVNP